MTEIRTLAALAIAAPHSTALRHLMMTRLKPSPELGLCKNTKIPARRSRRARDKVSEGPRASSDHRAFETS
jgi:hypothetical protein